ncbi:hypothetical protein F5878DRAFT_638277 [Lentinula raphanica]|uniref:Uncharacterized protein n=1 Tax=Lentinula raphanica TaxID=153919 RepID=A0AA38ULL6_9AGAR|nr:hypothetical protein F5878DRAFT_638277 [Lentinula raphanica]
MPIITADGAGMSTAKGLSGVISSILNRAASFCPQLPPSPHTNDASGLTCPLQPSLFLTRLWCFKAPANNSEFASLSTEDDDSEDDGSEDNSSEDDGSEDDGSEDDDREDDDSEDDDSEDDGYQQDAVDRGVNEGGGAQW